MGPHCDPRSADRRKDDALKWTGAEVVASYPGLDLLSIFVRQGISERRLIQTDRQGTIGELRDATGPERQGAGDLHDPSMSDRGTVPFGMVKVCTLPALRKTACAAGGVARADRSERGMWLSRNAFRGARVR